MYRAAGKLFSGGIAGKLLGVVRQLVLAKLFGTSYAVDAFTASQSGIFIPSSFLTTDALNAGFIPLYTRYRREEAEQAHALFWILTLIMGGLSVALSVALYMFAGSWMRLLVPGFSPKAMSLAIEFTKIMAIGMPFYVQSMLFSYLEMGNARYALTSIRATVQNVGMLVGILAAYHFREPECLAWGFTGSYIAYFIIGCSYAARMGYLRLPGRVSRPGNRIILKELWTVIRPILLLPVIVQGNFLCERVVASLVGHTLKTDGVVAALEYARAISDTGLVLIAWPIGLAGLVEFSRMPAEEAIDRLKKLLPILVIVLGPLSLFMGIYGQDIIRALYGRGQFNDDSIKLTRAIFVGLAGGFWVQVISYVLFRGLNALMRNRELALFTALGFALNILVNFLTYRFFGAAALGISSALGALLMTILAARALGLGGILWRFVELLLPGAAVYAPLALLIPGHGWWRLLPAGLMFAVYWTLWVRCVPPLWEETRRLFIGKTSTDVH